MFESYDLSPIGLTEPNDFSLLVSTYEREMDTLLCVDTSKMCKYGIIDNDSAPDICKLFVPNFKPDGSITPADHNYLCTIYEKIKSPCSMAIKSLNELEKIVLDTYHVSYAHYILGHKNKLKKRGQKNKLIEYSFPNYFCRTSSDNVMLSLMMRGYPNAMFVGNIIFDHAYVVLPFMFEGRGGVILSDPTSDQLWKNHKNKPRNMVSVIFGDRWKYKTDWECRANLYPDNAAHLNNVKNAQIRENGNLRYGIYKSNVQQLLQEAFSNPIQLNNAVRYDHLTDDFGC